MDIAPFRNIINEMYAKDTSRKIKSALRTRKKSGKYISSGAPFGYQKDPADHNHLVIDPNTAPVVEYMGVQADNLAGEYFITTGSGKFFRNVEPDPVHSIGIVEINDKGDSWRIVWGLEDGAKPTSEFPSHFMNHSVRKAATNGANRVIYHCHATNVIALTYILPLTDRDFTRALWQSVTECPVVFPEGVGVCPWMVPGGADIAMATSELMKTYQAAIWAQHGLFASGPDFDITFGLAHTIEKSAEIYVKVLSMGGGIIRQTITDDDLRAIARDFGVTLNEKFLN